VIQCEPFIGFGGALKNIILHRPFIPFLSAALLLMVFIGCESDWQFKTYTPGPTRERRYTTPVPIQTVAPPSSASGDAQLVTPLQKTNEESKVPTFTATPTAAPTATPTPTPTPDPYVAASNGLRLLEWTHYENCSLGFCTHYAVRGVIENPSKSYRSEPGDGCLYFDMYDSQGYFKGDLKISIDDSIPPTKKMKFDKYLTDIGFSQLEFTGFKGCWD